jgi:hypothetical protein
VNTLNWIICERTNRWAAALRFELAARDDAVATSRIHEVRGLDELSSRLPGLSNCLALVEVTAANLESVLTWIATANQSATGLTTIALLDLNLPGLQIAPALREAGAVEIADSPRRLQHVLDLGRRLATNAHFASTGHLLLDQTFDDWAMSLLPWQEA